MKWPWASAARLDDAFCELHQRAARIQSLEAQLDHLRQGQLDLADKMFALTTRVVSPTPMPSQAVVSQGDPDARVLAGIRDDTVQRMADSFVENDGMSVENARHLAAELARTAESLFS